jgi:phosphatidylglycerol:prolipoprotein diacylglycerol transferase
MHPILFRIPLPKTTVPVLYFYLAVIALGLLYAATQFFVRKDRSSAIAGLVVAALGVGAKLAGVIEKIAVDKDAPTPEGLIPIGPIPIYSYGVMLGLSLVVGWYLTLTLAERDGLPKETMANNYVVTAIAAIAGSRILYVLTNLSEFNSPIDIFALRRGGLVAYGGFLGGFVGSAIYLRRHRISLLPWADVAVPSLASGLMITRIGCYLFGCDFGRPLCSIDGLPAGLPDCASPEAPAAWLQRLGTFPRWAPGLLHDGNPSEGAPAWVQHVKQKLLNSSAETSLPVHPTEIYESLVGMGLLALLLLARRKQKFRGQIFLLFTFAYGVARYMLEVLRDDEERGSLPFSGGKHVMLSLGLALFAVGFAVGFSKLIKNTTMMRLAQVLAFVPAVVMYLAMAPASYGGATAYQWSTSQFVAITTGVAACIAFSVFYKGALAHPESAMRIVLPEPEAEGAAVADDAADADDEDDEDDDAPPPPPKKPVAKSKASSDRASGDALESKPKVAAKPVKKAGGAKKAPVKPKLEDDEPDADEMPKMRADDDAKAEEKQADASPKDSDED